MFRLYDEVEDGPGIRVGWMTGFVWEKNRTFKFEEYSEYWYGKNQSIFGEVHQSLEETRRYKEHKCVAAILFMIDLVKFTIAALIIADIFISFQNDTLRIFQGFFVLAYLLLLWIISWSQKFASWKLKRKLRKLMEQITEKYRTQGYEIRFPKYVAKCCVCIPCSSCCDDTDYNTVEVWSFRV